MTTFFIILGVIIIGALGWYLVSPLFIEKKVDEKFPDVSSGPSFHIPTPEELEQMTRNITDEERAEMRDKVMEDIKSVPDKVMEEGMPVSGSNVPAQTPREPVRLSFGSFQGADSFHQGTGNAGVYRLADGSHLLRFEDFSVTNGPDLRVLLSKGGNPNASIELARLKGNRGNQNYEITSDVNPRDYDSVIIYCKPFRVVFATAELR